MRNEIEFRKNYLSNQMVNTIYLGGGTPSFVPVSEIEHMIQAVKKNFDVSPDVEITVECNPDDLTANLLSRFRQIGINRLSIGVQSFDDIVLKFMNRVHNSDDIFRCIEQARQNSFENITVDLIYGIPGQSETYWSKQLEIFEQLELPHLSAYCLTIEPRTYFGNLNKKGSLSINPDEASIADFQVLMDFMKKRGYEQYEISNFAKPGFISQHNSAYWLGQHYLGIGPSAHSYNGETRSWNVANNPQYILKMDGKESYRETELLTAENKCNDYILTRLRTKWGLVLSDLNYLEPALVEKLQEQLTNYVAKGLVVLTGNAYVLSDVGKYQADGIAADLFI